MRYKIILVLVVSMLSARQARSAQFIRGDANLDGQVDISDPVALLGILFLGNPDPGCADSQDANDSGETDISDAVFTLAYLFSGGRLPPAPLENAAVMRPMMTLSIAGPPPTAAPRPPAGPSRFQPASTRNFKPR